MLSDEEKKAVEWFREDLAEEKENCGKYNDYKKQVIKRNEKILKLIKKQSKEIEELSDKLTEKICKGVEEEILEEYRQTIISKDKEIEELKDEYNTKILSNAGIYQLGFNDGIKSVEDKIKAKIEEWQKEKEFYNKDADREWGQYNNWDWIDSFINELQSLLEKE